MRKYIKALLAIVILVLFSCTAAVFADSGYPEPTSVFYVNDFANVLSSDTESKIAAIGRKLEDDTSAQVVVVTIDSLNGQDLKTYSIELASKWKIGQKDKDNGILILNAVSDRKVRIEVGYGLEGTLGAIRANKIIDETIIPYLKNGDYDSGLLNGYAEVVERVADNYGVDADKYFQGQTGISSRTQRSSGNSNNRGIGFSPVIILVILIIDGVFFRFRITSTILKIVFWGNFFGGGRGGRGGRGGWGGGGFGGGGFGGGGFGGGGGSSGGGGTFGGGGSDGSY